MINRSSDLKGKNLSATHRKVAERFVQNIADDKNIVGAVLLGGAAKGFADEFSDIDLAVFVKSKNKCKLKDGERRWNDFDLDLSIVGISTARKWKWTQVQRWTYSQGVILLDRKGVVRGILDKKVRMSETERKRLIVERIMLLGWLGISYEEKSWKDYAFFRPPDLWVKRGHAICAHELLNRCLDACLDLLFLCNRRFIPDEKWKLYLSFKLKWLPDNYSSLVMDSLRVADLNDNEFYRRLSSLKSLFKSVVQNLETQQAIPERIYRYLLKYGEYYSTV